MSTEPDADDDDVAHPIFQSGGPDREEMAQSYLPEQDDWLAKTDLDLNDPAAIAALSNFDSMFPEVQDLQPVIDSFLDDFERGKTSVNKQSRDEYRDIIMGMFGATKDDEKRSTAVKLVADDDD